jgi:hypothetical protein
MTEQTPDASVFDSIDPALKVVTAEIDIAAPAEAVFELVADPRRQPEWGRQRQPRLSGGRSADPRGRHLLHHDPDKGRRPGETTSSTSPKDVASPGSPPRSAESPSARNGSGRSSRPGRIRAVPGRPTTGPSCATRSACRGHSRPRSKTSPLRSKDSSASQRAESQPETHARGTSHTRRLDRSVLGDRPGWVTSARRRPSV